MDEVILTPEEMRAEIRRLTKLNEALEEQTRTHVFGEFVHEYNGEDVSLPIFEFEFEEEEKIRQDVLVSFTTDGDIKFEGGDLDVLEKVARDMVTNGLLLTNRKVSFIHETVILTYTLIGEGLPISMN